jgi:hypothetical protein
MLTQHLYAKRDPEAMMQDLEEDRLTDRVWSIIVKMESGVNHLRELVRHQPDAAAQQERQRIDQPCVEG